MVLRRYGSDICMLSDDQIWVPHIYETGNKLLTHCGLVMS